MNFHSADVSELLLSQAFPFHLVVAESGTIVSCGRSLIKSIRLEVNHTNLFDCFSIQHPIHIDNVTQLIDHKKSLFLLESKDNATMLFRGQLLITASCSQYYIFLISPWITDINKLDDYGFSLSDFPVHNPLSDFLILLQSQQISIDDSQRLSDELTKLNKELEGRVARRTSDLEHKALELMESKSILEHEMQERERVEVELRHAQKLESVGQLAAGIAHEINTPMQYIGSSLSFLQDSFSSLDQINKSVDQCMASTNSSSDKAFSELKNTLDEADISYICERAPKALDRALEGIERVTKIVRAMNEYAHPDKNEMELADINRALDNMLTVAKNEYKYVARIECDLGDIPQTYCYLGDLNQVFLNLIINASHAIADTNQCSGLIKVATTTTSHWIVISIADNGSGIPEAIQHRIFDPFFTTKEVGQGTGQGLAISHNIIVEKHGGKLCFETNVNQGTTFYISLPIPESVKLPTPNQHQIWKQSAA